MDLFTDSGAEFSPCRRYRYRLWRTWGEKRPALFLMLNPSTADEVTNDPTVARCESRARMMGYGGLLVANIFALRSTDPGALYDRPDPIGPGNDRAIVAAAASAGIVVCAWGTHGALNGRGAHVLRMLVDMGVVPHCLKLTKGGFPQHPLYVSMDTLPQPMPAMDSPA